MGVMTAVLRCHTEINREESKMRHEASLRLETVPTGAWRSACASQRSCTRLEQALTQQHPVLG